MICSTGILNRENFFVHGIRIHTMNVRTCYRCHRRYDDRVGSTYKRDFTIWMSTDPKGNVWKPLVDSFDIGGWDPAFFTDDDGRLYMYNGSSNNYPVYGVN